MLETLEYSEIIKKVSLYCKTFIGKESILNTKPSFNFDEVGSLLKETTEMVVLSIRKSSVPICSIPDIFIHLKQLESDNTLNLKAIYEIATILKVSRELKEYFFNDNDIESYPLLFKYFDGLFFNKRIEDNIFSKVLDENTIADNASAKLLSIRKSKSKAEENIRDRLDTFIHSKTYSKYLMDNIITIRNNRFVIPVKEEFKNSIKGFIHDISSSGSTVFIEPISIFDINNEINSLKIEENIEIERILVDLSEQLNKHVGELRNNIDLISSLDVLSAKVAYGKEINGIEPNLNKDKKIILNGARHPLIDKNSVVPINIELGMNFNSLIITGPNTGGKTVALKTVGLLLLMAYSGLYIPCNENSSIPVFDNIYADIGDEQSISESLSTFSSHMKNIINITNNLNSNSLVLLDELGAGTDPIEGANLAICILKYIYESGSLSICTTHYAELKNFALITDGFENASFEFDVENLKPTYNLLIGVPGKSYAFDISKKLGLNKEILNNALSSIDNDNIHVEDLLKSIYDNKQQIEKEKEEIAKNLKQVENLRKELEKDNSDLKQQAKDIIENAKTDAKDIIISAKEEVNEIINNLNAPNIDLKSANKYRLELNDKIKKYQSPTINNGNISKSEIVSGMTVEIIPLNTIGTVVEQPKKSNDVLVQIGNSKMNVKISNLRRTNKTIEHTSSSEIKSYKNKEFKSKYTSYELNVIGLNVDEALPIIDKYLDDCYISNIPSVRIIHGKGTGRLREGIHTFLKKHPHVSTFRLGTFGEGEMGVTIVEFKK